MPSQNGWPLLPTEAGTIVRRIPGTNVRLRVRAGDAGVVLAWVAEQWNLHVEPIRQSLGCWGWAYRPIRGDTVMSNHASGTAIDLNASKHPQGKSTLTGAQRAACNAMRVHLEKLAGSQVIRFGADYVHAPEDDMHVEIIAPPHVVHRAAVALYPPGPAPKPVPHLEDDMPFVRATTTQAPISEGDLYLVDAQGHRRHMPGSAYDHAFGCTGGEAHLTAEQIDAVWPDDGTPSSTDKLVADMLTKYARHGAAQ